MVHERAFTPGEASNSKWPVYSKTPNIAFFLFRPRGRKTKRIILWRSLAINRPPRRGFKHIERCRRLEFEVYIEPGCWNLELPGWLTHHGTRITSPTRRTWSLVSR